MTSDNPIPQIEDPLAEALHFLRMDGMFYCQSELSAPWGLTMPAMEGSLWFHMVSRGKAQLIDSSGRTHRLQEGDVVVLPHGSGHRLADSRSTSPVLVFDVAHDYVSRQFAVLYHGGGGQPTSLMCGVLQTGSPAARVLTQYLPEVITIDAATRGSDWPWFTSLMTLLANETRTVQPGGETVVTRLCDILVIQTIRAWIERQPNHSGWLGALQDPVIGHAIGLIHRNPGRNWTVSDLAAQVALSRSGFGARFTELVGQSPMQYVTSWRMELARSLLEDGQSILETAIQLGYQSEAAFSRAFKRVTGFPPSHAKRHKNIAST